MFPAPAQILVNQSQPADVLPSQTYSITASLLNSGGTAATNITLSESFDGTTPPAGSGSWSSIAANGNQSTAFEETVQTVPIRQSSETSVAYESRLGSVDGRLFTSTGVVTFSDAGDQPYLPVTTQNSLQLESEPQCRCEVCSEEYSAQASKFSTRHPAAYCGWMP